MQVNRPRAGELERLVTKRTMCFADTGQVPLCLAALTVTLPVNTHAEITSAQRPGADQTFTRTTEAMPTRLIIEGRLVLSNATARSR